MFTWYLYSLSFRRVETSISLQLQASLQTKVIFHICKMLCIFIIEIQGYHYMMCNMHTLLSVLHHIFYNKFTLVLNMFPVLQEIKCLLKSVCNQIYNWCYHGCSVFDCCNVSVWSMIYFVNISVPTRIGNSQTCVLDVYLPFLYTWSKAGCHTETSQHMHYLTLMLYTYISMYTYIWV